MNRGLLPHSAHCPRCLRSSKSRQKNKKSPHLRALGLSKKCLQIMHSIGATKGSVDGTIECQPELVAILDIICTFIPSPNSKSTVDCSKVSMHNSLDSGRKSCFRIKGKGQNNKLRLFEAGIKARVSCSHLLHWHVTGE